MIITTSTVLTGIIGLPITHSLSPYLHSYWLATLSRDGIYLPFSVEQGKVGCVLEGLKALGFRGINVTVPYKEEVMGYVDETDSLVRRLGAVNTVVFEDDGRVVGLNTDIYGFTASLDKALPDWRTSWRTAMVLGAGGAARAVIMALCEGGLERLYLINRTRRRAEDLASWLRDDSIRVYDWEWRNELLSEVDVFVNTTTLGMGGEDFPIDVLRFSDCVWVIDIVYRPLETDLLRRARSRRLQTIDGLDMLLYQGSLSFKYWFGEEVLVTGDLRTYMEGLLGEEG